MIHVVGLGPGSAEALPPRAFSLLVSGLPLYLRTQQHPVLHTEPLVSALAQQVVTALDDEYESNTSFDDTYAAIVERLLRAEASDGELVYAVPGHPLVGESTVARLLQEAKRRGVAIAIVPAPSFVDACLELLGEAITGDLHVVDALSFNEEAAVAPPVLKTGGPLLLYQVHSRAAASGVKLALMQAGYPDDFAVTVLVRAGLPDQQALPVALYQLDRRNHDHLTSVWVPPLPAEQRRKDFDALRTILAQLRDPETGCPWDLKQTHTSLRRYLLEETYEVAEAIDNDDPDALCEELGDLLLQVVFHGQLAAEEGIFDTDDICQAICDKLIRRHPHVFGEATVRDEADVLTNWNAIKAAEKGKRPESVLDGVTRSLPALAQALEVSRRVVAVGFEWPEVAQVLDKLDEELAELRVELAEGGTPERIAAELGDVLFTLVNLGRKLGVDAEDALRGQLSRFTARWRYIEVESRRQGRGVASLTLPEMEALWQEAKRCERDD